METLEGTVLGSINNLSFESIAEGFSQFVGSVARTLLPFTDGIPNQERRNDMRNGSDAEIGDQLGPLNVVDVDEGGEKDDSESCTGNFIFLEKMARTKLCNSIPQINFSSFSRLVQLGERALCFKKTKFPIQVQDTDEEETDLMTGDEKGGLEYREEPGDLDPKALPDTSTTYHGRLSSFSGTELSQKRKEHLALHGFGLFRGRIECVKCEAVVESGGSSLAAHKHGCKFGTIPPGRYGPRPANEGTQPDVEPEDGAEKTERAVEQPTPLRNRNRSSRRSGDLRRRDREESESGELTGQPMITRSQQQRGRPVQK